MLIKIATQQSVNDSFQRDHRCKSYRPTLERKLLNDKSETGYMHQTIDDIWYSPSKNTCFYSTIAEFEFFATENRVSSAKKTLYYINTYPENTQSESLPSLETFLARKNILKK